MNKNKKLIAILVLCIVTITVLVTQVIIPSTKTYKEQQKIKNATVIVDLNKDLDVSFYSNKNVSELISNINGTLIDDIKLNTKSIGEQSITFEYRNTENIKIPYTIKYNVIDITPPVVWLNSLYTVNKGAPRDFYKDILCGDDLDDNPECKIEGYYNTNVGGNYDLKFVATDKSGNQTIKPFTLYVKDPNKNIPPKGNSNTNNTTTVPQTLPSRTYLTDVIARHKNENTKIGIDVSRYQGDIDFDKVKAAGVEFAILRVGGTIGIGGEYFLDAKFKQNIEGFNRVGIPVGIYFFSYAATEANAIKDAEWVYEQIKDYKVELPVVYDWENWSFYNEFHLSFYNLTRNAESFLNTLKRKGYDGMIYGSKNYLEKIWLQTDYPIWIAHYTTDPSVSYEQYAYWQLCENGYVDGIVGNVDIDVMYIKD